MEKQLQSEQVAFRPGEQTQDHIYTIRTIIEKSLNMDKELFLAFLDLKAAFDQVPRKYIWEALQELQITNKLVNVIKSLYNNVKGKVRLNAQISKQFCIDKGVKHDDSLSPLLLVIYMNQVSTKYQNKTRKGNLGHLNLNPITTRNL